MLKKIYSAKVQDLSDKLYQQMLPLNNGDVGVMLHRLKYRYPNDIVHYIMDNRKVVSVALVSLRSGLPKRNMVNVYTHPKHRNKHYGSRLLGYVNKHYHNVYGYTWLSTVFRPFNFKSMS